MRISRLSVRRQRRGIAENREMHDRWLISYADLVTLLFTLFVVLYAAKDQAQVQRVVAAIAQTGQRAAPTISYPGGNGVLPGGREVKDARVTVEQVFATNTTLNARARIVDTKDGFIISMAEAGFFAPGEAQLRDDARTLLEKIAVALRSSTTQVRVEGHTDAIPISTARFPSNWELSSARASIVLSHLLAQGIPPARLSLAGYGGERPVADNATREGRELNRRVDLVVVDPHK